MKLLGWTHRMFRHNGGGGAGGGGDGRKDLANAISCNGVSGRSPAGYKSPSPPLIRDPAIHLGFLVDVPADDAEEAGQYNAGAADTDAALLFGGFLNIGTLGSFPIPEHPSESADDDGEEPADGAATPTFGVAPAAVDAIAEKGADATTETDLMVVSAEIEKVLAGAGGRISVAAEAYPLQGYLFGSPVEVRETRKERRSSLGELFLKSKLEEEKGEVAGGGGGGSVAPGIGKKEEKRRRAEKLGDRGGAGDPPAKSETKFRKILQIFHRKVHPDNSLEAKKTSKCMRDGEGGGDYFGNNDGGCNTIMDSKKTSNNKKKGFQCFKCSSSSSPSFIVDGDDPQGSRGHWIKTDAEYLVLEL